ALKGIALGAGAVVLQPFLNALAAESAGQAPPPRIIFLFESNGLWDYHIQPKGLGKNGGGWESAADKLIDAPLAGHELPEPISPLAPFKDRMSIVLGLSCKQANPNHGAGYGALGCYRGRDNANGSGANALAQTVDHALAGSLPGIIPVVGLGVHANPDTIFANTVSASAAKRPLPIVCQPDFAFQSLFGSVAEGSAAKAFNSRNKLLDWIRTDIRRVRAELPAMDREKLDIYLDTFEQMRSRQDRVAGIKDHLKANLPAIDKFDSKLMTDRFEAQCAVAVSALASRLTNVVVLDASCGPHGYKTWKELGVAMDGHGIGHTHPDDPKRDENAIPIRKFHAQRVADLAQRLGAIKEGNGTLLDNTLIVWMSDSAEEHHGQGGQWPMVVVGNLGGRLKTGGRFLQFPKYAEKGHRTLANFYLSLLHAVGDKRDKFGSEDAGLKDLDTTGPLAEIMA
ncbi:MAG: hypothetical protein ACI9OJ_000019, partial [Myxococcota bacterium]